ncbi:MAG: hypothetical protein K2V38_23675, partial [Gemmataceae bacterium]|nr:hypothetical protein [Gemmataceae bacterium]
MNRPAPPRGDAARGQSGHRRAPPGIPDHGRVDTDRVRACAPGPMGYDPALLSTPTKGTDMTENPRL